jgi:hypothetical protein
MNKKLFSVLLLITVAVWSCNKKNKPAPGPEDAVLSVLKGGSPEEEGIYNYVLINNSQTDVPGASEPANQVSVLGAFTDAGGRAVSAGDITINSRSVGLGGKSAYEFNYTGGDLPEGKALIGQNVDLGLTGSSEYAARRRTVYVPANIISYTLWTPSATIRRSADYPLKWYPDPNNLNGKMYIQLSYYGVYSRFDDPTLPRAIDPKVYTVNDNGSFTIPAADLQRFPIGGYITIALARGVEYIDPSTMTRTRVHYFTISDYQTKPLKVIY